jgi:tyrosine-protein kinase Etk/Wzc
MSENQTALQQPTSSDDEINLLDLMIVLAKHKKMIMLVTFAAALFAVGYSLLMPNIYTGTSKILPPQSSQSSSINAIMLAQLGGLTGGAAGAALGLKDPNALYLAMLKSRNIMEKIVRHFDLQTVYEVKTMTDALKALGNESTINSGKDDVIIVEVDDKDPQRAAALANAYIEELNKLMQTFALTEASQRGQFFENQMKPAKDKLTDAEITLDRTPNTSLQYMDALRNLRYQEGIYDILARQFAAAKLDEAKDSPLIQILDNAIPPEKKSKPKRLLIVILATLVAFFLAVIWAFIKEALTRSKSDPEQDARLQELRRVFRWSR